MAENKMIEIVMPMTEHVYDHLCRRLGQGDKRSRGKRKKVLKTGSNAGAYKEREDMRWD